MRKYKIYDVMFNNYRCGNKCCYKEYVDMKYDKKNKKNKRNMYNVRMLYLIKNNKKNKKKRK